MGWLNQPARGSVVCRTGFEPPPRKNQLQFDKKNFQLDRPRRAGIQLLSPLRPLLLWTPHSIYSQATEQPVPKSGYGSTLSLGGEPQRGPQTGLGTPSAPSRYQGHPRPIHFAASSTD